MTTDYITKKCVLGVPYEFGIQQKGEILDCAKIAGYEPLDIISEPIAASIYYGYLTGYKPETRYLLIINFGSTVYEVSIVSIEGNNFRLVSHCSDLHLGGNDIDYYLLDQIINDYWRKTGINIHPPKNSSKEDR